MPNGTDSLKRPLSAHMRVFTLEEIASTLQEMEDFPSSFSPLGFLSPDKCKELDLRKGEVSLRKRKLSSPTPSGMSFEAAYFDALELLADPIYCIEVVSVALSTEQLERAFYWGDGEWIVEAYLSEDGFRMSAPKELEPWSNAFAKTLLGETNASQDPLALPKSAYLMCQQFAHSVSESEQLTVDGLDAHLGHLIIDEESHRDQIIGALYEVGVLQNSAEDSGATFKHPIWTCLLCDKNIQVMVLDEEGEVGSMSFSGNPGNAAQIISPINDDPELLMATWPTPTELQEDLLIGLKIVDDE